MNNRQRLYLTSVITLGIPVIILMAAAFEELIEVNAISLMIISSPIVVVGVYFLSFKVWDKTEMVAGEDRRPRTDSTMNRKQRILFALIIAFVFPVNIVLALVLDILTGEYLEEWMLMPTSIIMAVGVYFLSFMIWDKAEQEVQED